MIAGFATRGRDLGRIEASVAEARGFLEASLRARPRGRRLTIVHVPMPRLSIERLFGLEHFGDAVLWAPPEGAQVVGLGAIAAISVHGQRRFDIARDEAEALFQRIELVAPPGSSPPLPRMLGGFAFAVGGASEPGFEAFGDGRFVLPRWSYRLDEEGAWLAFAAEGGDDAGALDEFDRILAASLASREAPTSSSGPRVSHEAFEAWRTRVDAACAAIDGGVLDKVVLARRSEVELDVPLDSAAVLERLGRQFPLCSRFAVRRAGATFLSATPERLIERRGLEIRTEAMAGSIAQGRAKALLESEKDRAEHAIVVDAILERLAPLCESLERSPEPRVRELPNVLHLDTPIRGRLARRAHVVDLVRLLHPTPAVGGVPSEAALSFLSQVEPTPRGWYSGPVGWFDREGDGEFVVALRSGLLLPERAYLYAGAGIVRGSRAELEYEETALKMQALLDALELRP